VGTDETEAILRTDLPPTPYGDSVSIGTVLDLRLLNSEVVYWSLDAAGFSSPALGDEITTVPTLAEFFRCNQSTIYRLLKRKQIPAFKIGSDWRFRRPVRFTR
jgi:excisionase family DNA binding protein